MTTSLYFYCTTIYKIGKPYSTEHVTKIIIGETSEEDLLAYFGVPWKTSIKNINKYKSKNRQHGKMSLDFSFRNNLN